MTAAPPSTYQRVIPESPVDGRGLGRHVNHDPRSRAYQVRPRAALARSVAWNRRTPVLDQGSTSGCTGNAACGALGTDPLYATLATRLQAGLKLDEDEALRLYAAATAVDPFAGTFTYPPPGGQDTGSDGLSVAKAAKNAGLISGYVHCLSLDAVITALQTGPVITGVNWYDSFDSPDASGRVSISAGAQVRGGHEFEIVAVDVADKTLRAVNSWGTSYGDGGYFTFEYSDYERLLHEDGDATQLVPLSSPAPTPTPGPGDALDMALVAAGNRWEHTILSRLTKAGQFRVAFDNWKAGRGY